MNSGLTRFKSAPSSYFSNIIDKEFYEHLFNRPSSPETERVFARFMNSLSGSGSGGGGGGDAESVSVSATASVAVVDDSLTQNLSTVQQQLPIVKEEIDQQSQTMSSMNNNETMDLQQLQRTQ
ncbi:transcription factor bHLH122-like, partial [Trifolium medium]|nr:transcription factor bHLH122-like [Trifolium medium]